MIKNENRLRKNKHFKYIYKHGKSVGNEFLCVVFVKTKFQPFKVGFCVTKKIGNSVVRNKVKRRLRESFCKLDVNKHFNYIFIAKSGIENLSFEQIVALMQNLLKKVCW